MILQLTTLLCLQEDLANSTLMKWDESKSCFIYHNVISCLDGCFFFRIFNAIIYIYRIANCELNDYCVSFLIFWHLLRMGDKILDL